jgi:2-polyprenyl-3-methyl-5-hydroxy-6-metoxy-1,4-benzoquinol methylase
MSSDPYQRTKESFDANAAADYPLEGFTHSDTCMKLMERAFEIVRRELGDIQSAHVVEAGCGNGYWLAELAGWPAWRDLDLELEGFDLSDEMIAMGRRRDDVPGRRFSFSTGNVLDHRPSRPADVAYCFDVIQHVPDPDRKAALENLLGMVRPGGLVLIADNHKWAPKAVLNNLRKTVTRYSPLELIPRSFLGASYPSFGWLTSRMAALGAQPVGEPLRAGASSPKQATIFRRA